MIPWILLLNSLQIKTSRGQEQNKVKGTPFQKLKIVRLQWRLQLSGLQSLHSDDPEGSYKHTALLASLHFPPRRLWETKPCAGADWREFGFAQSCWSGTLEVPCVSPHQVHRAFFPCCFGHAQGSLSASSSATLYFLSWSFESFYCHIFAKFALLQNIMHSLFCPHEAGGKSI